MVGILKYESQSHPLEEINVKNTYGWLALFATILLLYTSYQACRVGFVVIGMCTAFVAGISVMISMLVFHGHYYDGDYDDY